MITLDMAIAAVNEWNLLPFFERYTTRDRVKIADFLIKLIGQEDLYFGGDFHEVSFVKPNGKPYSRSERIKGTGVLLTPEDRLRWVVDGVLEDIGRWPENGMKDIRAFYCLRFGAADGENLVTDAEVCDLVRLPAPISEPRAYLPAPGDEPIGDLAGLIEAGTAALRPAKSRTRPPAPLAVPSEGRDVR